MITAALHDLLATILQQCDGAEFTVLQRARLANYTGLRPLISNKW